VRDDYLPLATHQSGYAVTGTSLCAMSMSPAPRCTTTDPIASSGHSARPPRCWASTSGRLRSSGAEDQSSDLVYCGSVFTHIDDLADTWFLELHRILRPRRPPLLQHQRPPRRQRLRRQGQPAAAAIRHHHDDAAPAVGRPGDYQRFYERTGGKDAWDQFVAMTEREPDYQRFRNRDAYMLTLGRSMSAHVMWDTDVLTDRLRWGYCLNVITPAAYGHQTTVLLERVPRARPSTSQLRSSVSEAQ
jgi:hypothetical protein